MVKMGTFAVPIQIVGPTGRTVEVEALVDTGASDTLLPRGILLELGVKVLDRANYELADQRIVEFEVGEVQIRIDGRERTALVVFGSADATPLLGATTMELFKFAADPVGRRLLPVPGLLKPINFGF